MYDLTPPATLGGDDELFAAGRLDNLVSVHAGLAALLDARESATVPVLVAFDHEEVGSASATGAAGPLLETVLTRLAGGFDARAEVFAASRALSCDVTHAAHPNYLGHHDPAHRAVPNGGPALKVNANQRYATDAPGAAAWARACRDAGVPHQVFVSRNTVPCGSTVGPIIATRLGIRTVDVGIPVLSMHSARELCGVDDPAHLVAAATAFLVDPRLSRGRPERMSPRAVRTRAVAGFRTLSLAITQADSTRNAATDRGCWRGDDRRRDRHRPVRPALPDLAGAPRAGAVRGRAPRADPAGPAPVGDDRDLPELRAVRPGQGVGPLRADRRVRGHPHVRHHARRWRPPPGGCGGCTPSCAATTRRPGGRSGSTTRRA